MHKRELSPQDKGEFVFLDANFGTELKKAETVEYRKNDLELICDGLNITHELAVANRVLMFAAGICYTKHPNGEVSEEPDEAIGEFRGFETIQIDNETYLTALIGDDLVTDEPLKRLIISERERYEWMLLPDYPHYFNPEFTDQWTRVAQQSFDLQDLLAEAASRLTYQPFGPTLDDQLNALELVAAREYQLYPGDKLYLAGSQALLAEPSAAIPITRQLPLNESSFTGTFEGLTVEERVVKGTKVSRLCLAVTLDDGSFVLQPCISTHTAEIVAA